MPRACDPYPSGTFDSPYRDPRRTRYLTQVLDRLDADEIREIARTLGNLHPRDFELQLMWIQQARDRQAAVG